MAFASSASLFVQDSKKLSHQPMGCINGKFMDRKEWAADVDQRYEAQRITAVLRLASNVDEVPNRDGVVAAMNNNQSKKNKKRKRKKPKDGQAGAMTFKFDAVVASKYEFKKLIGEGTMTRVWMVDDRRTRQPYAMKIADDKLGRECVDAEILIISRLKHPNVIHFVEVLTTTRAIYMVMDLATGGDLFDRIEAHGSFGESNATRVLNMVLEGIRYLHQCGIIHRDIKLDNLLFYHPGLDSKILIADFALAIRPDRRTIEGCGGGSMDTTSITYCGTPEYVAPEIIAKRTYSCAVDMWAVGVVAYTVLSSTFPFDADTLDELGALVLAGNYSYDEQWKSVSDCAKNFIDSLLVRDPKCRLTAVQALRHPWISGIHRTISSGSSSVASSSSSSGRSVTLMGLSSRRRQRRLQRRTLKRQQEALQNDPEWNQFRHTILTSVGVIPQSSIS